MPKSKLIALRQENRALKRIIIELVQSQISMCFGHLPPKDRATLVIETLKGSYFRWMKWPYERPQIYEGPLLDQIWSTHEAIIEAQWLVLYASARKKQKPEKDPKFE